MDFVTIKEAYEAAIKDISTSERRKFSDFFSQLETAIQKGNLSNLNDATEAIRRLNGVLVNYKDKKPVKDFSSKLKKLQQALEKGSNAGNPFKFIKTDSGKHPSPINQPNEVGGQNANRTTGVSRIPLAVSGKTAVAQKRPESRLKKGAKNSENLDSSILELVSDLQDQYMQLKGNLPEDMSETTNSPTDAILKIRHLFSSFTSRIDEIKCKAGTSDIKQVSKAKQLDTMVSKWLSFLKADIEKDQCTATFEGDTANEMKTTKESLEEIADSLKISRETRRKESTALDGEILALESELGISSSNQSKGKLKDVKVKGATERLTDIRQNLKISMDRLTKSESDLQKEKASLLPQLQELEKTILKIWNALERGQKKQDFNPPDALNELENFVREVKQTKAQQEEETNAVNKELQKLEKEIEDVTQIKFSAKKNESTSQRIKDISLTIKGLKKPKSDKDSTSLEKTVLPKLKKIWTQTEKDNGKAKDATDLNVMLDDLENYIKDCKVSVEKYRSTEEALQVELKVLQQDIDHFHASESSAVAKEDKTDPELVKTVKTLRNRILTKKRDLLTAQSNRSERHNKIEQHVHALTNIVFGDKTPKTQTTTSGDDDRDAKIALQLEEIEAELKPLEIKSLEIDKRCNQVHMALTGEQMEVVKVKSALDCLTSSLTILDKLVSVSSEIKTQCTKLHNVLNREQKQPVSSIECLKGANAALKNVEQANQEVEGAKQACNQYSDLLQGTYSTMLEIFDCTKSASTVKPITEKVPTWMQGLIIVVTKIDDCVQHNLERQFVESGPVLQILGKMHFDVMHEQYKKSNEVHVVGQKSQRRKDNVQGKTTNDHTSVVIEICEKVTQRYIDVETGVLSLREEKAELLNRLSKLAGANLTNNNPNIADLSDSFRPTKLAEIYSELYDNAWTDAFEKLEKSGKSGKENELIQFLLDILSESYRECADISRQQQLTIVKALTEHTDPGDKSRGKGSADVQLSTLQSKAVTELRKQSADIFVKSLQSYFEEKYRKDTYRKRWFDKGSLQNYTMKCINLCWLMQVQAPPVYIELKVKSGEKFDTNKFKQYTKSGNKIDFVVWPPLLLHEGGPLLNKGVAQGK